MSELTWTVKILARKLVYWLFLVKEQLKQKKQNTVLQGALQRDKSVKYTSNEWCYTLKNKSLANSKHNKI